MESLFFVNPKATSTQKVTYGFKSQNNLDPVPELREFEDYMLDLMQNIEFHPDSNQTNTDFQRMLSQDVREIKESSERYVSADKSSNHY